MISRSQRPISPSKSRPRSIVPAMPNPRISRTRRWPKPLGFAAPTFVATIDDLKAKLEVVKREHEGANAELRILEANECERPANPLRRSNARRPTVSALTPHIPLIPKVDPISAQATSFNVAQRCASAGAYFVRLKETRRGAVAPRACAS